MQYILAEFGFVLLGIWLLVAYYLLTETPSKNPIVVVSQMFWPLWAPIILIMLIWDVVGVRLKIYLQEIEWSMDDE
jgi:hypothetical protein